MDMEVPGFICIASDGTGQFQFGLVYGDIDGREEQCSTTPRFDLSWSGQEEDVRSAVGVGCSSIMTR